MSRGKSRLIETEGRCCGPAPGPLMAVAVGGQPTRSASRPIMASAVQLLSVCEDGGAPAGSAWKDGDECPDTVLPNRYPVEFAVELDRDGLPADGAAVGEPGVFAD